MQLTFAELLRQALPGGLFLLILAIFFPCIPDYLEQRGGYAAALITGLALIAGAAIQASHRAFMYVLIVRVAVRPLAERERQANRENESRCARSKPWYVTELEQNEYYDLVRLRVGEKGDWQKEASKFLRRWADQTHFLYACCWACVLALLVLLVFGCYPQGWQIPVFVVVSATFLFAFAFIDDVRHMQVQFFFVEKKSE